MQVVAALVLAALLLGVVVPNVIRYPWHSIVFVVILVGLASATGAGEWLLERMQSSRHPIARRAVAIARTLARIVNGHAPYHAGRWWIARTLVQVLFYCAVFGATLAVITAIGYVFTQMDGK